MEENLKAIGSEPEFVLPSWWRRLVPRLSLQECAIVVTVWSLLAAWLAPKFTTCNGYGGGKLARCKSNLKNLATALEMYAEDNDGSIKADCRNFPQFLSERGLIDIHSSRPNSPSTIPWNDRGRRPL